MKRLFTLTGLLVLVGLLLPNLTADEKKDVKKDDPAAAQKNDKKDDKTQDKKDDKKDPKKDDKGDAEQKKKEDKEKAKELKEAREKEKALLKGFTFKGKLTKVDGNSQGDFTVEVSIPYWALNQGEANAATQEQVHMMQIAGNAGLTPVQRAQQMAQAQNAYNTHVSRMWEPKTKNMSINLRAAEDMKVRTLKPPVEYDEKGKVKKYSSKELKELKGTGALPGYTSDASALQTNQIVQVYLAKKKYGKDKEEKMEGKKEGKKDKDAVKLVAPGDKNKKKEIFDELGLERPEVTVIVIMSEAYVKGS
jgi:hypothetical protein